MYNVIPIFKSFIFIFKLQSEKFIIKKNEKAFTFKWDEVSDVFVTSLKAFF